MTAVPLPGYCGGTLDRVDHIRNDQEALARTFADPLARVLMLDGLDPVHDEARLTRAPLEPGAALEDHVLLGLDAGQAVFARLATDLPHGGAYSPTAWTAASVLSPDQLALYGTARSLVDWHARHRFCAVCGGATHVVKAGWSRRCGDCDAEHFPRVDPVTIMLAEYKGRVLIGRQPRFPPRRYSALAGFVEPGETVEQAVERELFEEAGVRVHNVRYVMSQPWPFPSTLMIACMAQAHDDRITLDTNELEDAIWVSADDVRAALAGRDDACFLMPPVMAVAHHLFLHWLQEQDAAS